MDGPPEALRRIFYEALLRDKPPHDATLEAAVLGGCLANPGAARTAVTYLTPGDFTSEEHRDRFIAIRSSWEDSGGAREGEQDGAMLARCKKLRRLSADRTARQFAWEMVLVAYKRTAEEWCKVATEKGEALAKRIKESEL